MSAAANTMSQIRASRLEPQTSAPRGVSTVQTMIALR
jgi:hypothetical protein